MRWRYVTRVPESFAAKISTWFTKDEWMTFEMDTDSVDQHAVWKASAGDPVRRTDVSEGADALALYEMSDVFAEDETELDMFRFDFCDDRTTLLACSVEWMTSCEKVDDEFDRWVHFVAWVHDTVVSRVGRVAFALMQDHGTDTERRPEQHADRASQYDDGNSTCDASADEDGEATVDRGYGLEELAGVQDPPWGGWHSGDGAPDAATPDKEQSSPVDGGRAHIIPEPEGAAIGRGTPLAADGRAADDVLADVRQHVDEGDGAFVLAEREGGVVEHRPTVDVASVVGQAVSLGGVGLQHGAMDRTFDSERPVGSDPGANILRRAETELARIEVERPADVGDLYVAPDEEEDVGAGSHSRGGTGSEEEDGKARPLDSRNATLRAENGGRGGASDDDEPEWLKTAAASPRELSLLHELPVTRFELHDDTPLFVVQGILPPALLMSIATKTVLLPLASGTRGEEPPTIMVSVAGGTPVLGRKGQHQIRLKSYLRNTENSCVYQLKNTDRSSASQSRSRQQPAQGAFSRIRNRERTKSLNFMRFR
jgi:hypothetical protein